MKKLTLAGALIVIIFTVLAINSVVTQQNKIKLQDVQLKSTTTKLKELDLQYIKLQSDLDKAKADSKTSSDKVQQLEKERQDLENQKKDLEQQLQAKAEAKRQSQIAQASQGVVNAATGTQTAYAASVATTGRDNLRQVLLANGISAGDVEYALNIAGVESTYGANMYNSSSGACGYFQELPCGKWGGTANLAGHIRGADNYAKSRYGGWANAWAAWQQKRWW